MGLFKEIFDDALGIVQVKTYPVQPIITADQIVAAAVEQGVLKTPAPAPAQMEPIPMGTYESLWPSGGVIKIETAGEQTLSGIKPMWLLIGLAAVYLLTRRGK